MADPENMTQIRRALAAVREAQARIDALEQARREPIAIVGMGCRFPGADGTDAYWRLLQGGVDAIREVPPERWDAAALYDPTPATPGKSVTRWGGFVDGADRFDAAFFGISPGEAAAMDPQQRWALEVAWEAVEDAGLTRQMLAGSRTGVFIGATMHDYGVLQIRDRAPLDAYFGTGNVHCIVANRLSYWLDLRGPSLATDTACSSSLVGVHLACQSLRSGESDLAIAGGVNLMLLPELSVYFSQAGMMSADGRCKAFDALADGYVRGEGCGVVVLKRLSSALADGDRIHALVRGVAVNQDGRTNGLTAPNGLSQREVARQALAGANLSPAQIGMIEAHGTGTSLGDPIEVEALRDVYGAGPGACLIGSVKSNIGHLEAAAGVASLIKAVLALQHEAIPPSLHVKALNPSIALDGSRLVIPSRVTPWPRGAAPRLAAVSSFGFGGTNAHAIVEEAPAPAPPAPAAQPGRAELLVLSGHTPDALRDAARAWASFLDDPRAEPRDLAWTASVRRTHHRFRLAVAGASAAEWRARLEDLLGRGAAALAPAPERAPGVAMVFSGQGPQWWGMGRELMREEPVFRAALEECERLWRELAPWSLLAALGADEADSRLDQTEVAQPALFAVQWALAQLWRSWGVVPRAVAGHSIGEIAAACVAGALTLKEALLVLAHRGRLMQRTTGRGAMASVGLSRAEVEARLARAGAPVSVAAVNAPRTTVIAGPREAVAAVVAGLRQDGVGVQELPVRYAFHSAQMEELREELREALAPLRPRRTEIPLVSTLTGLPCDGERMDAAYWSLQAREPVLFQAAVEHLADRGCEVFVEVGPHPVLAVAIDECLRARGREPALVPSLRRKEPERATMLSALGALHTRGCPVDFAALYPSGRCASLPRYAWQRERFWFRAGEAGREAAGRDRGGHPILGAPRSLAADGGSTLWEWTLDPQAEGLHFLRDHVIKDVLVVPGAALAALVLAAGEAALGPGPHTLDDVMFHRILSCAAGETKTVQLMVSPRGSNAMAFRVSSLEVGGAWTLHASGCVRTGGEAPAGPPLAAAQARCTEAIAGPEYYAEVMEPLGYMLGASFRGVRRLWRGDREIVAELGLPDGASPAAGLPIHPGLLDSCFQCSVALAGTPEDGSYFVPGGLGRLRIRGPIGSGGWLHLRFLSKLDDAGLPRAELRLHDDAGAVRLEIQGLSFQRIAGAAQGPGDGLFAVEWTPRPLPPAAHTPGCTVLLADAAGLADRLAERLRRAGDRCVVVRAGRSFAREADGSFVVVPGEQEQLGEALRGASELDGPCRVVHLWSLDAPGPEGLTTAALAEAQRLGVVGVLRLVHALSQVGWREPPRLWLVTRGVIDAGGASGPVAVAASPVWGMGRVLAREHADLRCALVDLDARDVDVDALLAELSADDGEDQVALRPSGRHVARLVRATGAVAEEPPPSPAGGRPYGLELARAGSIEGLVLREAKRRPPGKGEVEIEIAAAGLNFRDVMSALGFDVGEPGRRTLFGFECAGKVVRVGEEVDGLAVGQDVVAIAANCVATHATTDARLVWRIPAPLTYEEAVTIPVTFGTALFGLDTVGRVAPGERVLIHAAAGGVGLAAIQVARWLRAEIYATAGTPAKRELLRSMGIEHVMDSRSLDFAEEVMRRTDGEGVDAVLNSLAGEFIPKGLSVLRAYGRFLEIGKRDIYEDNTLDLGPFRRFLTYVAVDLIAMCRTRPSYVSTMIQEIFDNVARGVFTPLPYEAFPISAAHAGAHYLASGKNVGKVVFTTRGEDPPILARSASASAPIRSDGSYLITGGLGGLGLVVASWLVERGARALILLGRGAPSPEAEATLERLRGAGAQIRCAFADVADAEPLAEALRRASAELPPLRGVIHAAGVLDDGVLAQLDEARLLRVMAPKVQGAWNLHALTADRPLDFFVLFSSIASVLGSPGQASYAAANAFLDALARHRRASGLPAQCVHWGPWAGVGMAARTQARGRRSGFPGLTALSLARGVEALARVLASGAADVVVMPVDWRAFFRGFPDAADSALLAGFAGEAASRDAAGPAAGEDSAIRRALLADEDPERLFDTAVTWVREQAARALWTQAAALGPEQSLISLGFDSLMLVELRNRLQTGLGVQLSMGALLPDPTIVQVARHALAIVRKQVDGKAGAERVRAPEPARAAAKVHWGELQAGRPGQPPLIFVHALVPSFFPYLPLVRALGPDQPAHAIAGPSLDDDAPVPARMEDIAADYVEDLVRRWPSGPLLLCGHSFGGSLAFEMARQLHALGRPPALVTLIDALSPATHRAHLPADWRTRRPRAMEPLVAALGLSTEPAQQQRLLRILHAHIEALTSYTPGSLPGSVLFFRATERSDLRPPGDAYAWAELFWEGTPPARPESTWAELATGGCRSFDAPGWHHTMLDEPTTIAEHLRLEIAAASARASR